LHDVTRSVGVVAHISIGSKAVTRADLSGVTPSLDGSHNNEDKLGAARAACARGNCFEAFVFRLSSKHTEENEYGVKERADEHASHPDVEVVGDIGL
jgi:hypothetical protein